MTMKSYLTPMTDALKRLISFYTAPEPPAPLAPFGKTNAAALAYTLDLCRSLGFTVKNLDGYAGYAEYGAGETFGVLCHLDVVPFLREDWTHDPLGGEIVDGKLYGRGALDDKGPTVAALYAVKALIDQNAPFRKKVRFIFGLDEEGGEWKSVMHYFKKEGFPSVGIAPDADFPVIYSEKGKVNYFLTAPRTDNSPVLDFNAGVRANIVPDTAAMTVTDKRIADEAERCGLGVFFDNIYKITAVGRAAHGAHPDQGENAAMKLLKVLSDCGITPYDTLYGALADIHGSGLGIDFEDKISGKLTLNAGVFRKKPDGNLKVEIDIRYPHNTNQTEIKKRIKKHAPSLTLRTGSAHPPLYVPETDPLVQTLLKAYDKVTGGHAKPVSIGGATFARALPYGVAFGPVFPDSPSTIHQADENISIDDFLKCAEIYYEAFKLLLAE